MPEQYRRFPVPNPIDALGRATGTVVGGIGAAVGGNSPIVPDAIERPLSGLDDAVARAGTWATDRNNWFRVAKVIGGGALIVVGLAQLVVKPVAAVAGAVAPVGKIAKKVAG